MGTSPAPPVDEHPSKKRKVRKGTASCWECKRRKNKCSWTSSIIGNTQYDGCRRRDTECISQEYPDGPLSTKQPVNDRLGQRLDALLERHLLELGRRTQQGDTSDPNRAPESKLNDSNARLSFPLEECDDPAGPAIATWPKGQAELAKALRAAWPGSSDLEAILSASSGIFALFPGLISMSYSWFTQKSPPSLRSQLHLPQDDCHPILIARQLIIFALLLQNLDPAVVDSLNFQLSATCKALMDCALNTATRLATSDDDLVQSIEGVECIIMEAIHHDNAGNLRRAHLAIRRALTVARLIGLDHIVPSRLPTVNKRIPERTILEHMWFRIVQIDVHLSLVLGLPPGCQDERYADSSKLDASLPLERLERTLALACSRLLTKSRIIPTVNDLDGIREIDKLILNGANAMPPKWWAPAISASATGGLEMLENRIRIMTQLTYFHLLQRLHLPHLLRSPTIKTSEHSKMATISASRELLSRFLGLRSALPIAACVCRGMDLLAFTSAVVLCLAHIDTQFQGHKESPVFLVLSHQRASDRGMLEQLLELMTAVQSVNPADKISARISSILQPLLKIEADVKNGDRYFATASQDREMAGTEFTGGLDEAGCSLEISIPHLGVIKVERHIVPRREVSSSGNPVVQSTTPYQEAVEITSMDQDRDCWEWQCGGLEADTENWDLQGVDLAFFDDLFAQNSVTS